MTLEQLQSLINASDETNSSNANSSILNCPDPYLAARLAGFSVKPH